VIERGMKARAPAQNRETDHAIAEMAVIGLVEALSDSLHAEHGLIKIRHSLLIFGVKRQMPDSRGHDRLLRRNFT
jgi:hypothetical protein